MRQPRYLGNGFNAAPINPFKNAGRSRVLLKGRGQSQYHSKHPKTERRRQRRLREAANGGWR